MSSAGCEVYELFPEPDGTFPNHHPDPSLEENLKDLSSLVKEKNLDFMFRLMEMLIESEL